jgi:eukaryotic-like serine/threonine-protein kinase
VALAQRRAPIRRDEVRNVEERLVRASQLPTAGRPAESGSRAASEDALVLGRYRLGERLGAGAFGTVWQARDEHLDREVAVKIVPRERIVEARFEREARAAARLSHPAIVTLYEAAADEHSAYLVSELVRGATLGQLLEAGRLSDRDVVAIGFALCDALAHAHSQGIVHRDVKPSNVLVPEHPASAEHPAKLTDFGVARVIDGDSLTATGDVVGTAAYMAPEQAVGRPAGAAADLYALALVCYESLTGVNPIVLGPSGRRAARLGAHLPALRRQRRDLPRDLGQGIDLALRPRPPERGTIEDFKRALSSAYGELRDMPGVVEGPWRPRLLGPGSRSDARQADVDEPQGVLVPRGQDLRGPEDRDGLGRMTQSWVLPRWQERALACACMALLSAWLARRILGPPAIAPAAVALLGAGIVLLLPRVGFVAVACVLAGAAALRGHSGEAVIVVVGALITMAALPRRGVAWPLAAGAPALGAAGLAGAWPAFAAGGRTAWQRGALGAAGWIWLLLATPLSGAPLYLKPPTGLPPRGVWSASAYETIHHVLAPLLDSGALAGAPVWAIAAVALPHLVRRRSLALDAVRVTGWAAFVASVTELAVRAAGAGSGLATPRTAVMGAIAAAMVGLWPSATTAWRQRSRSNEPQAGIP